MSHISVLSRFDKSGQWLASIVPSLDIHRLRVHSTSENITLSLKSELDLEKSVRAISLEWIVFGTTNGGPTKKRRNSSTIKTSSSFENLALAIGTNMGSVIVYSPSKSSVLVTIDASNAPISSISQVVGTNDAWITDGTNVSRCNLSTGKVAKSFKSGLSDGSVGMVRSLASIPDFSDKLLLSSTAALLVDPVTSKTIRAFSEFAYPITNMELFAGSGTTGADQHFVTGSINERMIVVNKLSEENPANLLVAQSNIRALSLSATNSTLAVLTEDGSIEVFINPLVPSKSLDKKRRSSGKKSSNPGSKVSDVHIKIVRPTGETPVLVEGVIFDRNYVVVVWYENGTIPVFEKVQWQKDDGSFLDSREVTITKARISSNLKSSSGNKVDGVDAAAVLAYNESQATVTSGRDFQEVGSDDDDDTKDSLAEKLNALEVEHDEQSNNNKKDADGNKNATTDGFSTPGSFAVILSQALETNDHALLETCLANREEAMIKVSVQRLKSALAVRLLERLAEKMGRSPTRTGQLNIWIKWVMICHGGYIVTIPNLLHSLSSLHYILSDRVSTLPRLLALQGRLEMLQSQIELRNDSKQKIDATDFYEEDGSEMEEEVEYVEDQEYIVNGEEDFEGEGEEYDSDEELKDDEDEDDEEDSESGFISIKAADYAADSDNEEADESLDLAGYSDIEDDEAMEDELDGEDEEPEESTRAAPAKKTSRSSKSNSKNKK